MFLARLRPISVFLVAYLCLSFALRIVLWLAFGEEGAVRIMDLAWILPVGVFSDLLEFVYLSFPFALLLCFAPEKLYRSSFFRSLVYSVSFLITFGLIYLCLVEFYFFEEFDSRFNLVAVDYLIYPTEVLVNLWESYPIVWCLIGTLIVTFLAMQYLWRHEKGAFQAAPITFGRRVSYLSCHSIILLAVIFALPTDRLEPSENRVAVEIASNGLSSLFRAFRTQELDYNLYYNTLPKERAYELVRQELVKGGGEFVSSDAQNITRRFSAKENGLGKLNVVVVGEESLGAAHVSSYGGKYSTPILDDLAKKGIMFKNVYASGTRTARGLEAITASIPPIPSESILKRSNGENIATWGSVMMKLGYHTSFLYGGYGQFDNMNRYFSSNGFAISDRLDIKDPIFANIWGVSDQDLFRHAVEYFDNVHSQGKPFFSVIMTVSNHKPFTLPEGIPDIPSKNGGREAGVRYADYAIGQFMESAKTRPWFNDTIFVIVADHDARVYGRSEIPVNRYKIPLVVYAPSKLAPRVVEKTMSQIDIAPTILGLLGLPYEAPFYGQDTLANNKFRHPIFLNHNHDVALFREHILTVLQLNKKSRMFRYKSDSDELVSMPEEAERKDMATAYYQTAFDLFQSRHYK